MKSMGGSGEAIVHGALTPTEALSYAMSVPGVSTTISGMDSMAVLDQNLADSACVSAPRREADGTNCATMAGSSTTADTSCSKAR